MAEANKHARVLRDRFGFTLQQQADLLRSPTARERTTQRDVLADYARRLARRRRGG
ncbi:MAG: hypothetical protein WB760_02220 [Xanthobacteraceae bacterium]